MSSALLRSKDIPIECLLLSKSLAIVFINENIALVLTFSQTHVYGVL